MLYHFRQCPTSWSKSLHLVFLCQQHVQGEPQVSDVYQENILKIATDTQLIRNRLWCLHARNPTPITKSQQIKVLGSVSSYKWDNTLNCMILENYHNSNALSDFQRNSGVLSEELVLGNLGLGLWQQGSPISVWLLSGEEASSDFPPRNERERGATLPLCDNASSTKVNKACCVSVTKGGLGGQAVDDCDSCVTTQCPE